MTIVFYKYFTILSFLNISSLKKNKFTLLFKILLICVYKSRWETG